VTTDPQRPSALPEQHAADRLRAIGLQVGPAVPDPIPSGPRHRSWRDLDLRSAAVVSLVAALAIALAGWVLWRARPHSVDAGPLARPAVAAAALRPGPAPGPASGPASELSPAAAEPTPRAQLLVDVEGTVRRPGVVMVPAGSRVRDALAAAGGVVPGAPTVSVNLAEPVSDGEQVVVGGAGLPAPGAGRAAGGSGGPVDLNTATEADLQRLPGIGPVLAGRVLDFRRTHGRFSSVEELREVPGIGPAKFAALRSRVRV
jgi:competence protein ComEA